MLRIIVVDLLFTPLHVIAFVRGELSLWVLSHVLLQAKARLISIVQFTTVRVVLATLYELLVRELPIRNTRTTTPRQHGKTTRS
jgi:hypothetical protein